MPDGKLTPKQRAVKALLAQGMKPREIAGLLGVSTQAIYRTLQKLREKPAS